MCRLMPVLLLLVGCDASSTTRHRPDSGLIFGDEDLSVPSAPPDLAVRIRDAAVVGVDAAVDAQGGDLRVSSRRDAGAAECGIKVNEVVTATLKTGTTTKRAADEFVELYNSCSTSFNLSGWSLTYRSAGNNGSPGNADVVLVADLKKTLAAGGYLLFAGSQYPGTSDQLLQNGLNDDTGGGVAVWDNANHLIDSVAYGDVVPDHNFLEGTNAPLAPVTEQPGSSIGRSPNGADTNDNGGDFTVETTVTPKAANP
jgi:hypothetical protein